MRFCCFLVVLVVVRDDEMWGGWFGVGERERVRGDARDARDEMGGRDERENTPDCQR
jgi:hypothetical protein